MTNPRTYAIKLSKERNKQATPGPWESCNGVLRAPKQKLESMQVLSEFSNILGLEDCRFTAHARTWEPKWREMVETAIIGIERALSSEAWQYHLSETLKNLTRLAKEGLENK